MSTDNLFKTSRYNKKGFNFGEEVADSFDDMIRRSVPFYQEIQRMIVELTQTFMKSKTNVYDIGCSTAGTLHKLLEDTCWKEKQVSFIGIDNSEAMLKKARKRLRKYIISDCCQLIAQDINKHADIDNASVVILSLTLQFTKSGQRKCIISQIFSGLKKNGCLILVEKLNLPDNGINREFINYYEHYKLRNGYSRLEINNKKKALKNVLRPNMYSENVHFLKRSGFKRIEEFFRWYNFSGVIAFK